MSKRIRKRFENTKLSNKMLLIYLIFASIFLLISIVALQVSLKIYDGKLYEKSMLELDFFTQKVNDNLEDVKDLCYSIALDTQIQESLSKMASLSVLSSEYSYEKYGFRILLMNELNSSAIIKNLIYTDEKRTKFKVGLDCGTIADNEYNSILEQFHEARGGYVVKNPTEEYPYLLTGCDILEVKNVSLNYLGSFLFTCDVAGVIDKHINSLQATHAALFVYSEDGMIYQGAEQTPKLPSLEENDGCKIIKYQGQKYFMCYLKSSTTGWMYVNIFPYSEIYGQTMVVRDFMLVGFFAIFILSSWAMKRVSYIVTKPLERLSKSMRIVETGDFQGANGVLKVENRQDEVGLLTQEFQFMLEKINELIKENYEKQILLKDTKYKMLQAQINPHFLYNTLNAINWMVKAGRNEEAGKMIIELGELLRASFAQNPYATIEEELNVLKSYITIQQFRYQSRADFVIETEGNVDVYIVPRMILQPLVENSINYAVDNSLEKCQIVIRIIEEDESILIVVKDNGPGIKPEDLEKIRNFTIKPKGNGIGLKNIRERLSITYEYSSFEIESQLEKGTSVQIRVSKKEGMMQNV